MAGKKAEGQEVLAKRVSARQKLVEEIVDFVQSLVAKKGTVLSSETHSCHTTTKAELNNFAHFSFYTYGSYTMFGGETVKLWYHPSEEKHGPTPTFEVEYWDIKECTVKHFDRSVQWQRAMRRMLRNKKKVVARAERVQKEKQSRAEKEEARTVERERVALHLQKDVQRLAVV